MVPTGSYSYTVEGIKVKVLSANCQGLQDSKKCFDVLNYFKESNAGIICLLCGDFNLALDPKKDTYNYKHVNNPQSRHVICWIVSIETDPKAGGEPPPGTSSWSCTNPFEPIKEAL